MGWEKVSTTDEMVIYLDEYGNFRIRSTITGRFLPTHYSPNYGRLGYGDTVEMNLGR